VLLGHGKKETPGTPENDGKVVNEIQKKKSGKEPVPELTSAGMGTSIETSSGGTKGSLGVVPQGKWLLQRTKKKNRQTKKRGKDASRNCGLKTIKNKYFQLQERMARKGLGRLKTLRGEGNRKH